MFTDAHDRSGIILQWAIDGEVRRTLIGAYGYAVFDESHFNPTPETPGPDDFALSGVYGGDVWLL